MSKRPAQDEGAGQRRSKRKSAPPERLGFLPDSKPKPKPTQHESKPTWSMIRKHGLLPPDPGTSVRRACGAKWINQDLKQHNKLLAFLDKDFRPTASFRLAQQKVESAKMEADRIMLEAHNHVLKAEVSVERQRRRIPKSEREHVIAAVADRPYWWERGNVFTLEVSQIRWAFERYIPEDAARFVDYLYRLINDHQLEHVNASPGFLDKALLLREVLLKSEDPAKDYHCFHFSVYLMLDLMAIDPMSRHGAKAYPGSKLMRSYISSCLNEYSDAGSRRVKKSQPLYLDAAAAYDRIIRAYKAYYFLCRQSVDMYEEPDCLHEIHISVLNSILKRAHQEVREKAHLATSARLPVELADLVADYALAAEGLPEHSSVFEGPNQTLYPDFRCALMRYYYGNE